MVKISINLFFVLSFITIYIHLTKKIILYKQDLFFMGKNIYSIIYLSKKI